jgi:hypothetical protein
MPKTHSLQRRHRKVAPDVSSLSIRDTAQPALAPEQETVVSLQRTIGNMAIQRLMAETDVATRFPQKGISKVGKFLGSRKSKSGTEINQARTAMLSAVRVSHSYLKGMVSHNPRALRQQMEDIAAGYDNVVRTAEHVIELIGDPDDQRSITALELKVQATNEKTSTIEKFLGRIRNPPGRAQRAQTVAEFIGAGNDSVYMDGSMMTGHVGGGMNKLTKYATTDGSSEYFKPNVESIDTYDTMQESQKQEMGAYGNILNSLLEIVGAAIDSGDQVNAIPDDQLEGFHWGEYGSKANFARAVDLHMKKSVNVEFKVGGGIDLGDLRSAQREVAMARLDTLLGSDLISRAKLALKQTGLNLTPQLGSVAREARGKEVAKYNRVDDSSQHPGTSDTIRKDDPVLLSKVSGLFLLDMLAGQVDRHQGNFMIQVDRSGNVTGITGIDNDMGFGTRGAQDLLTKGARELPLIGKYFDADMAAKVIALEPALIRMAMSDLLSQPEVQAIIDRLMLLKAELIQAQSDGNLLQPNQWMQLIQNSPQEFRKGDYAFTLATAQ